MQPAFLAFLSSILNIYTWDLFLSITSYVDDTTPYSNGDDVVRGK